MHYYCNAESAYDEADARAAAMKAPTVARQQSGLDPRAHEAAAAEYARHHKDGKPHGFCLDVAISAYLSHAAGDVAGLARRMVALHDHLTHQPITHADSTDMATIREAATAISALSARAEAAEARVKEMEAALEHIQKEAAVANDVIRLNRDGGGNGRVKVATAMHRIAKLADAARSLSPIKEAGK